jgi:hypothetical protein
MNKYRISIARLETRIYYFDIEAESEEVAEDAAWLAYDEDDPGEGECVHSEEWRQDTEVLNETI